MTVFEVHLGRVVPVSLLSNQSCAPSPHPKDVDSMASVTAAEANPQATVSQNWM